MNGDVVAWRNRIGDGWHYCERDPREFHDNGKQTDALVLATDYAALLERLESSRETNAALVRGRCQMDDEIAALQAKLDAVTKDALALQGRVQRAESLLREVQPFIGWTGSYPELHAKIDALTDQGRAGEVDPLVFAMGDKAELKIDFCD